MYTILDITLVFAQSCLLKKKKECESGCSETLDRLVVSFWKHFAIETHCQTMQMETLRSCRRWNCPRWPLSDCHIVYCTWKSGCSGRYVDSPQSWVFSYWNCCNHFLHLRMCVGHFQQGYSLHSDLYHLRLRRNMRSIFHLESFQRSKIRSTNAEQMDSLM